MLLAATLALAGAVAALDAPRVAIPMGLPTPSFQGVPDYRVLPAKGGVA